MNNKTAEEFEQTLTASGVRSQWMNDGMITVEYEMRSHILLAVIKSDKPWFTEIVANDIVNALSHDYLWYITVENKCVVFSVYLSNEVCEE